MATAADIKLGKPAIGPIDVTRAEFYSQDLWQETFAWSRKHMPIQEVPETKLAPSCLSPPTSQSSISSSCALTATRGAIGGSAATV